MNEFTDYPLSVFYRALRTVIGRILLVTIAVALGAFLGGLTATMNWAGGWWAVSEFHRVFVSSVFTSVGILALPGTLIVACAFARYEWPLYTVLLATLLIWWNTHNAVTWIVHDSPTAQIRKMFEEVNLEIERAAAEGKKQEAAQPK